MPGASPRRRVRAPGGCAPARRRQGRGRVAAPARAAGEERRRGIRTHRRGASRRQLGAPARRRGGAVLRRVPPFAAVKGAGFAGRIAPSGFLFSTEADLKAASESSLRVRPAYAPLAVDPSEHDALTPASKVSLGAPPNSRLIVCVHDGSNKQSAQMALRTLSQLAPRHPDLHLVVVGTTRLDEVRMHGAALGINSMISYLGA